MPELNIAAIVVAGVASFAASAAWYMIFGNTMVRLQSVWRGATAPQAPEPWKLLIFLVNQLVIAVVLAVTIGLVDGLIRRNPCRIKGAGIESRRSSESLRR